MNLYREGREWLVWPVANVPTSATVDIRFSTDRTWRPTQRVDAGSVRLLVAGPDATANPAGTAVLRAERTAVQFRFVDGDEIVIRDGGYVDLT